MLKENLKGAKFPGVLSPFGTAGVAGGELCLPALRPRRGDSGHPDPSLCALRGGWCGQTFCFPTVNTNFIGKNSF